MEYNALMNRKAALWSGFWQKAVGVRKFRPNRSNQVSPAILLSPCANRLIAQGFMKRSATQTYDDAMTSAVQQFQLAHGLSPDGVAGPGTITEMNKTVQTADAVHYRRYGT